MRERVGGMHCASCERLISQELGGLPSVTRVRADARRGIVEIISTAPVDRERVGGLLAPHGYTLGARARWLSRDRAVWRDVLIGLAIVSVGAVLALLGVFDAVPGWASSSSSGLALPLLVGLAAGVSTCMATVGGLVLGLAARHTASLPADADRWAVLRPHLVFNGSRLLAFVLLGALTGAVGSAVGLQGTSLAVVMMLAAVVMLAVGIQLASVSPRLAAVTPRLPRRLGSLAHSAGGAQRADLAAAGLGAASFFVPCGFTQAVQVAALSTGDPLQAGAMMGAFALGTLPALLALAGAPSLSRGSLRQGLLRVAGVAVIALAAVNLAGGLRLVTPQPSVDLAALPTEITSNVTVEDGVQVVRTTLEGFDYLPADAVVYAGLPTRWEITTTGLSCSSALVAPELGVPSGGYLPPGETSVFEFVLDNPGRVDYECSMGMFGGSITAIPQPS